MPPSEQDQELKAANEIVVAPLREAFDQLTTRLTWEIEAAPVYSPDVRLVEVPE